MVIGITMTQCLQQVVVIVQTIKGVAYGVVLNNFLEKQHIADKEVIMARLNTSKTVASNALRTYEGAVAKRISKIEQLERSVMCCLLWEDTFYESGVSIAERIQTLIPQCDPKEVYKIAVRARNNMKLRHIPLLIAREMARGKYGKELVGTLLPEIIQRPDELTEFLAIYWKDGKTPISAQVKKGLAKAFTRFDAYQLAKYDREGAIRLRDVLFLCHAKPESREQESLWKQLIDRTLPIPDTWEVKLSAGGDKKEVFTSLISEKKLGALALLRNLRNMIGAGVDEYLIKDAIHAMKSDRVLPYRFIAAAKYAPAFEPQLEEAMMRNLASHEKLPGKTVLLVDVSGSMDMALSGKSDLKRVEAACGLAILLREICEDVTIYSFSNDVILVPPRRGFALADAIVRSQWHSGTKLGSAVSFVNKLYKDRVIVITDEQSHDTVPNPYGTGYLINVASYQNGVGYGDWIHIDGFSEAVIDYISTLERYERGVIDYESIR